MKEHSETLTPSQLEHFNSALSILKQRLELENIRHQLLDLDFNGSSMPLPFPDLHWEIVAAWMMVDRTLPPPIPLSDGTTLDYTFSILKDQQIITRWKEKIRYARTGFKYK